MGEARDQHLQGCDGISRQAAVRAFDDGDADRLPPMLYLCNDAIGIDGICALCKNPVLK